MEKFKYTPSLADNVAGVLTTIPLSFDPEDSIDILKTQVVESHYNEDENNASDDVILSQFRKSNLNFLADVDERYVGKKTYRKNVNKIHESCIDNSDLEVSDSLADEDNNSTTQYDESEQSSKNSSCSENSDDENINDNSEKLVHLKDLGIPKQLHKAYCVRNQMSVWESLLEIRIQLQKCLITANKLPSYEYFKEIKDMSGSKLTPNMENAKKGVISVLDKMLNLQNILLNQYPETKNLFKNSAIAKKINTEDDEEILSDTEDEMCKEEDGLIENLDNDKVLHVKKRKRDNYEECLNTTYKKYRSYSDFVIQKWSDKTRLTSLNKNCSKSYSVIKQIEYALSNKEKLIKKTQLKKSNYDIIGCITGDETDLSEKCYTEIFDDDDFYHQLLRDLIECKSSDVTDPIQLGRQWIQLQSLRSKMRKKVDTKATKGRKIRYAVHSKLVNFMAPIEDNNLWTDEAKIELYNSIFGNVHQKKACN